MKMALYCHPSSLIPHPSSLIPHPSSFIFSLLASPAYSPFLEKTLIVTHDQLGLDLLKRVHGHAHHNQQGGSAEVKAHAQPAQEPVRKVAEEVAAQPPGQLVQLKARDQEFRQQTDQHQVNGAGERQAAQNPVDILRRTSARPYAGN